MTGMRGSAGGWAGVRVIHAVGLSVCLLAVAAVWVVAIGPALQSRAEARAQRSAIAAQRSRVDALVAQEASLRRDLVDLLQQERSSSLRLESAGRINRRLSGISDLAADSGLDLAVIRPGQVVRTRRFEIVPIELAGTGTYAACTAFLHEVNRRYADLGVAAVDLQRQLNSRDDDASFKLTLAWYAAPGGGMRTAGVETRP